MGRANFLDAVPGEQDTYFQGKPWVCPGDAPGRGSRAVLSVDTSQKGDTASAELRMRLGRVLFISEVPTSNRGGAAPAFNRPVCRLPMD